MSAQKKNITIIVNGVPVHVERNENAPLMSVVEKALHDSGNVGQPISNWELTDSTGTRLDLSRKIETFHFPDEVTLFLSLKAGIGG